MDILNIGLQDFVFKLFDEGWTFLLKLGYPFTSMGTFFFSEPLEVVLTSVQFQKPDLLFGVPSLTSLKA